MMAAEGQHEAGLPDEPYRGLEPYRYCDRAIFFERELEAERLLRLVTIYRGSLLYGESGVGKSSLVNAGFIPRALANEMAVERIRVQLRLGSEFLVERIPASADGQTSLESFLATGEAQARTLFSAEDFLQRVTESPPNVTRVLIFDQFEEWLTQFNDKAEPEEIKLALKAQHRILKAVASLSRGPTADHLRLLLVFREEYLPKLDRLFFFAPELPDQFLRLVPPSTNSLRHVIRGPFENQALVDHWQRRLSEEVLAELERQLMPSSEDVSISLPRVQISALQLWRSIDPAYSLENRKVSGLVDDYLVGEISRFQKDRGIAEALLALLITPDGTRKIQFETEFIGDAHRLYGIRSERALSVLKKLVSETRLVRRDSNRGATTYEIVSEFLVPWIRALRVRRDARRAAKKWLLVGTTILVVLAAILSAFTFQKWRELSLQASINQRVHDAEQRATAAEKSASEFKKQLLIAAKGSEAERLKAVDALMAKLKKSEQQSETALQTAGELNRQNVRLATKNQELDSRVRELETNVRDLEGKNRESSKELETKVRDLEAKNRQLSEELENFRQPATATPPSNGAGEIARLLRLGYDQAGLRSYDEALKNLQDAERLGRGLVAGNQGDESQRSQATLDLAYALELIGTIHSIEKRFEAAIPVLEEARGLFNLHQDKWHADDRSYLYFTYYYLGKSQFALKNFTAARLSILESLDLRLIVGASVVPALNVLRDIELQATGNSRADSFLKDGLGLPSSSDRQPLVAKALRNVGNLYLAQKISGASEYLKFALKAYQRLAESNPKTYKSEVDALQRALSKKP